jgi:hypothetical protein
MLYFAPLSHGKSVEFEEHVSAFLYMRFPAHLEISWDMRNGYSIRSRGKTRRARHRCVTIKGSNEDSHLPMVMGRNLAR